MAKIDFKPKVQRSIGRIDFRPTLLSFESVAKSAQKLENQFEEWVSPQSDFVALFSPSKKESVEVTSRNIVYMIEQEEDIKLIQEYLSLLFTSSVKEFKVNQVRRIGFRKTQILSAPFDFDEIANLVYKKFYSQENVLGEFSGRNLRDTVFVLDSYKNGFLNHVQIGPLRAQEAPKYIQSKYPDGEHLEDDKNLFIDVDVFLTEGLSAKNTLGKFSDLINENERIFNGYRDYLSE